METKDSKLLFRIDKYDIIEDDDTKYVVYLIDVETATQTWQIGRRYSEFRDFNNAVEKYIPIELRETIEFPGKIIFSNFKDKSLQLRRQKLEQYLNKVACVVPNLLDKPFARELLGLAIGQDQSLSPPAKPEESKSAAPAQNKAPVLAETAGPIQVSHKRAESSLVFEFLRKLNTFPLEIANAVEKFEQFYFANTPQLTRGDIQFLFLGDSKLKGLLNFCGDANNYIASRSCIQLFWKLITYDYNSMEAENFAAVFCSIKPEVIREMNLGYAIREIRAQTGIGQNALYQYLIGNPYGISEPGQIIEDKVAIEEYDKWIEKKSTTEHVIKKGGASFSKADNEAAHAKIAEAERVKAMLEMSLGQTKMTKLLVESSNLSSLNDMKELMDQLDNYAGWKPADPLEDVQVYTKGSKNLRFTLRLHTPDAKLATKFIYEVERRARWEPIQWVTLKKDSPYQDIVQVVYEQQVKKAQYVEYVLFRNIGKSEDGKSIIIISRSIILPPSSVPAIKRVHVNACVHKLSAKEGYTECQSLWRADEGYESMAEYAMWARKLLEGAVRKLNELIGVSNN